MPESWDGIEELFEAASALPVEERPVFLRQACGENQLLYQRVQSLLASDEKAGDEFLTPLQRFELVGSRDSETDALDPLAGAKISSFTIASVIARGGMGTVYLAEQGSPRRNVALKVMHSSAWTASAEKRFDVESQILAYLRHPNIAQVHEAGSHRLETGGTVRYFAMEYVPEARTIVQYAADKALSLQDRLDLFLQSCDAVQHGHQKGVIHRDLKPANILVDPEGRVKVIDFGIARSTDSDIAVTTMHTEAGQLLGTLAYMSPEQCAADPSQIDTTTDIYSLGVILYELLTGRMPYDVSNMTIQSAARVICESAPTRPSALDRRLRGDAETIILKAIEKDRNKRYESANDFSNDVRRYLRGEPIEARPPTAWTQALRWAFRRPKAASALACLLMAGTAIGATSVMVYWVNLRPHHIDLSPDRSEARLATWQGRPLHTWNAGAIAGITFAELVERPVQFGGGQLALLGFSGLSKTHVGRICAFELQGDLDTPKWEAKVEIANLPDDVKDHTERCGFHPAYGLRANFFPSQANPGDEIAVVFAHSWSRRLVRIYDLTGKPLYGFWQDGGVDSFYWMKDAGLLVCGGASEANKPAAQRASGTPSPAPIVFAVRPVVQDTLGRTYLIGRLDESTQRTNASHDASTLVWCKYLHPPGLSGLTLALIPDSATGAFNPGDHVGVAVSARSDRMEIGRSYSVLDSTGAMIARPRAGDKWEINSKKFNLPDPKDFTLSDDAPP